MTRVQELKYIETGKKDRKDQKAIHRKEERKKERKKEIKKERKKERKKESVV